jgi:hypothetical protein
LISPTGYACFNVYNGTCCADRMSICPNNTYCNLPQKRCDRYSLAFLEDVQEPNVAFAEVDITSSMDFIVGFLDGFSLFNDIPNQDKCRPSDPKIIQQINHIVDILKNVTIKSDFKEVVAQVLPIFADLYDRIVAVKEGCLVFAAEVKKVVESLKAYVQRSDYLSQVSFHGIMNLAEINKKVAEAKSYFQNGNLVESGRTSGVLVRFVFFWDFKSNSDVFLERTKLKIDPLQIKEFVVGLNEGFTYFKNLPHFEQCDVQDEQFVHDVEEIIEILENISVTNISKVIPQLIAKGLDVISRLSQVSASCKELANESLDVLNKLKSHVSSIYYVASLVAHTTTNIGEIKNKAKNAASNMSAKQYRQSGNAFGELAKFSFFWSFKN